MKQDSAYGVVQFRQTDGTTERTILELNAAGNADYKGNVFIDNGYLRTPQLRDDSALTVQGPSVIIEGWFRFISTTTICTWYSS